MARWIDADKILNAPLWQIEGMLDDESITFTLCEHCELCIERGGHANCSGYLYCTLHKTQVTETDGCTWGRER